MPVTAKSERWWIAWRYRIEQLTVEIRQATSVHWKSWDAQSADRSRDSAFLHLRLAGAGFRRSIRSRVPKRKAMESNYPAPKWDRLSTSRNPQGAQKAADIVLHDLVPVIYVAYWLIFIPKSSLRWKDVFYWLFYPLGYFDYSLIRGAAMGWYPYPFIDASRLGYARVLANAALLVCSFLAVALLAVAIGRWMDPKSSVQLRQSE
jgi:hypothetical protein